MSAVWRHRASEAFGEGARRIPEWLIPGAYLTNERDLFCVCGQIGDADGEPLLELEDCRTMNIIVSSAGVIDRLRLRPVQPAR